jgi:hypothetical protein
MLPQRDPPNPGFTPYLLIDKHPDRLGQDRSNHRVPLRETVEPIKPVELDATLHT